MKTPFIIGIGGAHSGIGKTTIAAALLKYLTKADLQHTKNKEQKVTHKENIKKLFTIHYSLFTIKRWGAIKYTKTAFYSTITDDRNILYQKDKDTRKLLDAGAAEVLWVQSPKTELVNVLPTSINRLSHLDGIIIEGNSAIEFLKPDIVIFLFDGSEGRIKPSAEKIIRLADIVISRNKRQWAPFGKLRGNGQEKNLNQSHFTITHYDEKILCKLLDCIEMTVKRKEIESALMKKASEDKITCAIARKIAEELEVPYKEVGNTANNLKIKIKDCELGCF